MNKSEGVYIIMYFILGEIPHFFLCIFYFCPKLLLFSFGKIVFVTYIPWNSINLIQLSIPIVIVC